MPLVRMKTTAAGPERVLEAGKVYNLSQSVIRDMKLLTPQTFTGDDKKVTTLLVAAELITSAQLRKNEKIQKLPPQPDPEDSPAGSEEIEDLLEDEQEG